jgi:hypothetical protein
VTPSWGKRSLERRLERSVLRWLRLTVQKHEREEQSGPEQRHHKDDLVRLKPHDSLTVRGTAFFRRVLGFGFGGGRGPAETAGPQPLFLLTD